jgi:hypothetical protein
MHLVLSLYLDLIRSTGPTEYVVRASPRLKLSACGDWSRYYTKHTARRILLSYDARVTIFVCCPYCFVVES